MKKYIALLLLVTVSFAFTACDDETEPGGTAVEKMAGTWIVTWEAKNEAGKWAVSYTHLTLPTNSRV